MIKLKDLLEGGPGSGRPTKPGSKRHMENSSKQVSGTLESVLKLKEIFQQFLSNAEVIKNVVNESTESMREQAVGIENINQAMNDLSDLNNENQGAINEVVSTSESLARSSKSLESVFEEINNSEAKEQRTEEVSDAADEEITKTAA